MSLRAEDKSSFAGVKLFTVIDLLLRCRPWRMVMGMV